MRKINILKPIITITNILMIICFILTLVLKTKIIYSLYWVLVPLLIFLLLLFINSIDKGKLDKDLNKSKQIKQSYSDMTTVATVFYGIVYLIIEFFGSMNTGLKENNYLIIGFFIITIVYELFIYLSINKTSKEISKILNK